MDMAFIKVLNMSISASWLVLAVFVLRLLLKRSPKWIYVALWALVAVRLVCPISFESVLSLIPSGETIPETIVYAQQPAIDSGVTMIDQTVNDSLAQHRTPQTGASVNPLQIDLFIGEILWCLGMAAMVAWSAFSYFRLKKKVDASIDVGKGVFICDYIDTPFILGVVRPKIYLPSSMEPDSASHVLAHERAHIARKDHWWKPFGYLLLTVYWFNPLLWLAYILLCRDIELACDEKVIRDMEIPQKKAYSEALLSCSVNRRYVAACPLAFGEVGVKERVKTVLNYKKPAFWIVLVAVLALIVTAICFLTDPVKEETRTYRVEEVVYRNPLLSYYMTEDRAPLYQITKDNSLRYKTNIEDWTELGEFSEIRMSDLHFNELFFGSGLENGIDLEQLREENREVWMIFLPPAEEFNSAEFYLLFRQENGETYLAEGIWFPSVNTTQEAALDPTSNVNWLYRLQEGDSVETEEGESPYTWTSTLEVSDITFCAAVLGKDDWAADPVEGAELAELIQLLNQLTEDQIQVKKYEGEKDPLWVLDGVRVHLSAGNEIFVLLNFTQDTLVIKADDGSGLWKTDGDWVIESQELKDWMQNVSYGNATMLSEENREEIRQLLRTDYVEYFTPQEYDDLLFVGCQYDGGRGLGVAVYEHLADGYRLLRLIRDEDVKKCASGSDLYYCDYNQYRIFLVLNRNITAMEWAGAYENTCAIDTHPGLVVEYFPENLDALYRFCYSGSATTMYMDWENNTVLLREEHIRDPREFREWLDVSLDAVTVGQTVDLDAYYRQNACMVLDQANASHIWYLLSTLPDSAMEPATEAFSRDRYVNLSFRIDKTGECRSIQLALDNGCIYYSLMPAGTGVVDEFWKIDFPELTQFIEELYEWDTSQWEIFTPYPKSDGQISFEIHGVKVNISKLLCFEYEETEYGIRFKPENAENWVELQYRTEPFGVCGTGLKSEPVDIGRYSGTKGIYDDNQYWSFLNLQTVFEEVTHNIVLLNEDVWAEEFESEIQFLLNCIAFQIME